MKKETVSYVRHIMRSDFVQLDIFNAMISVAIIVLAFVAFSSGGNLGIIGAEFILGAVLGLFNLIKSIMKRTPAGILVFSGIVVVLSIAAFVIFGYLM